MQISDTHLGFKQAANPDPAATLGEAIAKINALPTPPAFLVHTGDISHLSKEEEWDAADQIIKGANKEVFYIPGEHDVADVDNGKAYLARYGKKTQGRGWYSFDAGGVHFIALINVFDFQPGFKSAGLAQLGDEQLEWLEKDVEPLSASTPIVVLAHLPLWTVYEQWGWGTADAGRALGYLKRFGSVTVLNGHIHQIMQKVEGNLTLHTAMSTAFPQPAPGTAPAPARCRCRPNSSASISGCATSISSTVRPAPGPDRNPARRLGSRSMYRPLFVAIAVAAGARPRIRRRSGDESRGTGHGRHRRVCSSIRRF